MVKQAMRHGWTVASWFVVLLAAGCMTPVGQMTRRDAAQIVANAAEKSVNDDRDARISWKRKYSITADQFYCKTERFDAVWEKRILENGSTTNSWTRGKKMDERVVNIQWRVVTRVVTSDPRPFSDSAKASVEFFYTTHKPNGDLMYESFVIQGLFRDSDVARNAVGELALAIKVLAGIEPAAPERYSSSRQPYSYWLGSSPDRPGVRSGDGEEVRPSSSRPMDVRQLSGSTEEKLRKLKDWYDQKLITLDVYEESQREVLKGSP